MSTQRWTPTSLALPATSSNCLKTAELAIENSPAFRGHTVLGDEVTNGRSDWRDQLDLGRAGSPDLAPATRPGPTPRAEPMAGCASLHGAPSARLGGGDGSGRRAQAVAVGLGLPIDHWDAGLPESDAHLKIIRYPAHRLARPTIKASVCTPTPAPHLHPAGRSRRPAGSGGRRTRRCATARVRI